MTSPYRGREPWPGIPPGRRRIMAANRRRDTGVELAVRSALHRRGLRFRVDYPIPVPERRRAIRPDVVFTKRRLAVFVDGCFWHRCPDHFSLPASNREYWLPKLDANVRRDREADAALSAQGWSVVRIWEHEPIEDAADHIEQVVRGLVIA